MWRREPPRMQSPCPTAAQRADETRVFWASLGTLVGLWLSWETLCLLPAWMQEASGFAALAWCLPCLAGTLLGAFLGEKIAVWADVPMDPVSARLPGAGGPLHPDAWLWNLTSEENLSRAVRWQRAAVVRRERRLGAGRPAVLVSLGEFFELSRFFRAELQHLATLLTLVLVVLQICGWIV